MIFYDLRFEFKTYIFKYHLNFIYILIKDLPRNY